jgi:hypothetical protein
MGRRGASWSPETEAVASGDGNVVVASALMATLARAWATIVENPPEVPELVVVVASGSGRRTGFRYQGAGDSIVVDGPKGNPS